MFTSYSNTKEKKQQNIEQKLSTFTVKCKNKLKSIHLKNMQFVKAFMVKRS